MSDARAALAEDVFVGISHSVPFIKLFWKAGATRLSKAKITELLEEGKSELHSASEILADPTCKAVLSESVLNVLVTKYLRLHIEGKEYDQKLASLKSLQILRKYEVWIAIEKWSRDARKHKHDVWTISDWGRICNLALEQHDASVGGHTTMVDAHRHDEELAPLFRRFMTLAVHAEESSESLEGNTETIDSADHDDARDSDMDSIFGNPFLGYTVEIQQDSESVANSQ